MRRSYLVGVAALLFLAAAPAAEAADSVVVKSLSVAKGSTGVTIPIFITNGVALEAVVVPLAIREQTPGCFITSLTMSFGDRITGTVLNMRFTNQYASEDGTCKEGQPGGFGTITYSTSGPNPVAAPPEGVAMAAFDMIGIYPLPAGADASGSMILTVDVTSVDGTFEIDTTCTNPANHLLFDRTGLGGQLVPTFTKGIITVGSGPNSRPVAICQNVSVGAGAICEAWVEPQDVDGGSWDPDGDPIEFDLVPEPPYSLGQTFVKLIVTDVGGLADTCDATITVLDETPPVITCPGPLSVECLGDVPPANTGSVTVSDNCDPDPQVIHVGDTPLSGGPCGGTITRRYRATDASGNFRECTQTITVNDTESPQIVSCPNDTAVDCMADLPAPNIGSVSATDNCGSVTITHEGDIPLPGGSCGFARTYRATDECGNFVECTQMITVTDAEEPVIVSCPDDMEVQCVEDVPEPNVTLVSATDNCSDPTITHEGDSPLSGGPCGGTITRTYRATDDCGNWAECFQTFTVDDTEQPVITDCPSNTAVQCLEDVPPPDIGSVTAIDNCGAPTITHEGDTPLTGGPCGGTVTRTYRATDDCDNWVECFQTFTVDDTEDPEFTSCPNDTAIDVHYPEAGAVVEFTPEASDNCIGIIVECTPSSGSFFGEGTTHVTCVATDACDNADTCHFDVTINIISEPKLEADPDTLVFIVTQQKSQLEPQRVTVSNPGSADPLFYWVLESVAWMSVDPDTGTTESFFDVYVDTSGLDPGTRWGKINVISLTQKGNPARANLEDSVIVKLTIMTPAPNRVHVASTSVGQGATGVSIPIRLTNDVSLNTITVPLVVREITTGSYISALALSYGDRLPEGPGQPLSDIVLKNQFPAEDGTCKEGNPGGFGTPGPVDCISPDGLMFERAKIMSPALAAGSDATGSLLLTIDVTGTPGSFEIDTTCTNPNDHLLFVEEGTSVPITPAFTKGIITILSCACPNQGDIEPDGFITALDLSEIIDILFSGHPDVQDSGCPSPRFDLDCDGFTTALDLSIIIDHLFSSGPGPCDPCAP